MFILKDLMENKGYKYIKTERPEITTRLVTFRKLKTLKYVTIKVDERKLQGISNRVGIEIYYEGLIKEALKECK